MNILSFRSFSRKSYWNLIKQIWAATTLLKHKRFNSHVKLQRTQRWIQKIEGLLKRTYQISPLKDTATCVLSSEPNTWQKSKWFLYKSNQNVLKKQVKIQHMVNCDILYTFFLTFFKHKVDLIYWYLLVTAIKVHVHSWTKICPEVTMY